jgi:hypothetical protein
MVMSGQAAELGRLLGADRLARPARPLGEGTNGRRDPSPTWDDWYTMPLQTRRQLLPFMAPAGQGLKLDDIADMIGAGSIADALERWAQACQLARRGGAMAELDRGEVADWERSDALAESDALMYGPAELAELLGTSVANVHQRRHRGQLPEPDLTLSRVPIWTGETLRLWQEWAA